MKKFFLAISICVVVLSSFASKPPKMLKPKKGTEWVDPVRPVTPKNIYGNWTWIETDCCGMRHGLSTPLSTGDNIELELKEDNTFLEIHTKPNALPRSGNCILFKENLVDMLQFNDERPAQYFLSAKGDTLTISWKYLELQTEKYLRKK